VKEAWIARPVSVVSQLPRALVPVQELADAV
jgi:hypothetical protein